MLRLMKTLLLSIAHWVTFMCGKLIGDFDEQEAYELGYLHACLRKFKKSPYALKTLTDSYNKGYAKGEKTWDY